MHYVYIILALAYRSIDPPPCPSSYASELYDHVINTMIT